MENLMAKVAVPSAYQVLLLLSAGGFILPFPFDRLVKEGSPMPPYQPSLLHWCEWFSCVCRAYGTL
jgi:hypothetical protein